MKPIFVTLVILVQHLSECMQINNVFVDEEHVSRRQNTQDFKFEITLPVFSTAPNPQWKVGPDNKTYAKIEKLFRNASSEGYNYTKERMPSVLGYKGFLVRKSNESSAALVLGPETKDLQKLLLQTMPQNAISANLTDGILKEIENGTIFPVSAETLEKRSCFGGSRRDRNVKGPAFEWNTATTQFWNTNPRKIDANCYNYVNNVFSPKGSAVPGRKKLSRRNGDLITLIRDGAVRDGLKVISGNTIPPIPRSTKKNIVALFVSPGDTEMHWYRLDRNTRRWSHKPGALDATDLDRSNNQIPDPRNANHGQVNFQFVCFMETDISKAMKKIGPAC